MKSGYCFRLKSTYASLTLFFEQRLAVIGKVIACELQRPYADSMEDTFRRTSKGARSASGLRVHGGGWAKVAMKK